MAEAAVVGRPDETTGEAICAFVVLKRARPTGDEAKKIANELRNWVAKEIGPIAKPKDIRFGDNLPKTRSGKIMRRLLRSLAKGETDHPGHQHAGEPGDPGAAGPGLLIEARPRRRALLEAQHPLRQLQRLGRADLRVGRHRHRAPDARCRPS